MTVIGRNSGSRLRRTVVDERTTIEFADLLDDIEPADHAVVVAPEATIADLVMFRVAPKPDEHVVVAVAPIEEPIPVTPPTPMPTVSRFANTGIDDDLLPLAAAPHRRFHH